MLAYVQFKTTTQLSMACSADPGRKTAYSEDLRWRVVWQRLSCEMSYRGIAQSLNISLGTVRNVWDTL